MDIIRTKNEPKRDADGFRLRAPKRKAWHIAQVVKAGNGWLVTRNSATLASTDYENIAREIADALNKNHAYPKLVAALRGMLAVQTTSTITEFESNARATLSELGEL